MTEKTIVRLSILTVVYAMMIMTVAINYAYAEFPSPLKQINEGISANMIQCNDDKVLVQSHSGKPACVKEDTANKLENSGWEIIQQPKINHASNDYEMTKSADTMSNDYTHSSVMGEFESKSSYQADNIPINREALISDDTITISTFGENSDSIGELGLGDYYWPKLNMTFPEQVRMGEPFDVVLDYTYVLPDEDGYADGWEEICVPESCERKKIWIAITNYVDYLNSTDVVIEGTYEDYRHLPERTWTTYSMKPPFDNTKPLQETFTFVVNEPDIDYPYGDIDISFNGDKPAVIYFNVAQDGIVYFDDDIMQSLGEGPGQLRDTPLNGTFTTRAERLAAGPVDGPPNALWKEFKDHLSEQHELGFHDGRSIREVLSDANLKPSWINKFLKFYPELDIQVFNPTLHWILPQAFGQGDPTSFVYGQISNTDPDGTTSFVHGVTVCAYDALESDDEIRVPITINGKNICSETTESGTFSFHIPRTDLNDSGTPDVAVRINADNKEIIIYKNNNRNLTFVDSVDGENNINPDIENLGIINLS